MSFLWRNNPARFYVAGAAVLGLVLLSVFLFSGQNPILDYDAARAEARLAQDPTNTKLLRDLGAYYYEWGMQTESGGSGLSSNSGLVEAPLELSKDLRGEMEQWRRMGYDVGPLQELMETDRAAFLSRYQAMRNRISDELFEKSIRNYRMAMAFGAEISPEETYRLGFAYFKRGKFYYYQAAKYLQQALDEGLASSRAYTFLGNIAYETGDLDLAVSRYQEAIRLAPREPIVVFNLAWACKERGLYSEAVDGFERVLSLYPRRPENLTEGDLSVILKTRFLLGWLYLEEGNPQRSVEELTQALAAHPDSVHVLYWLGKAYLAAGQNEEARESFRAVLEIEPNYRDTRSLLNRL